MKLYQFVHDQIESFLILIKGKLTKAKLLEKADQAIDAYCEDLNAYLKETVRSLKKEQIKNFITDAFNRVGKSIELKFNDISGLPTVGAVPNEDPTKVEWSIKIGPLKIDTDKKHHPLPPPPPPHHGPHHGHHHPVPPRPPKRR